MITLDIRDGIADLVLNRPPVNALDGAMVERLAAALDAVEAAGAPVLVIRSGQTCFSAGADLAMIRGLFDGADPQAAMGTYVAGLHRVFDRLEALKAVTVAAISGPALGGGLELALACDLRLAAAEAKLGLPETRVGLIPGAGGTQRLARLCGPSVASRLILGAELVDGREAERLGLVQWCVPRAELDARTRALAERIAGLSPPALAAAKACILAGLDPAADGYAKERAVISGLMALPETRARVARFFERSTEA